MKPIESTEVKVNKGELESRSWRGVLNTTLSDKVCQ
jgi:hypothetical protein